MKSLYGIYLGIIFAAMVLSVPLAFVLPVEWSFENGLIENAQVAVLILGAVLTLTIKSSAQMKWFRRFFAAGLFLMALRELSWGRVFFPVDMEDFGEVFVSMADYPYRIPVYIFLAIYGAAMLFVLIKFVPVKKILLSRQPLAAFALILATIILAHIGDKGRLIDKAHGQILEELNELLMYLLLLVINFYYTWQQKKSVELNRRIFFSATRIIYFVVH